MDSPELTKKLLKQAREWMHAVIDEEDAKGCDREIVCWNKFPGSSTLHQPQLAGGV
jgi:hypothetical protein